MPRLEPLRRENLAEFEELFAMVEQAMGFVPNSLLTMAHRPDILRAALDLFRTIQGPGRIAPELKALVALMASQAAGCRYCQAHTGHTAHRAGADQDRIDDLWNFEDSPFFSAGERAALRVARDGAVTPNAVQDAQFEDLKQHYNAEEIVELVATIAMFGFLNRWNDTMATELEASPLAFAQNHLDGHGWSPGKHAG